MIGDYLFIYAKVNRLCSPGNRARGPTPTALAAPKSLLRPTPTPGHSVPASQLPEHQQNLGIWGLKGRAPPSAVSPFPRAVPKIQPCSPVPRFPPSPTPATFSASWRANCSFKSKDGGRGRRRGRAAALGAHLAPEPGEPRGGQETREPPLPWPPSRPPPPPPSQRCLPGFEPSPAEPRAPVETKTDRTAGTAATVPGGPDPGARRGRRAPPVRCTKEPGRPVPSGGLGLGRRRHSPECWAAGSVGPSQARGFGGRLSSGRSSDAGARQLRRSP